MFAKIGILIQLKIISLVTIIKLKNDGVSANWGSKNDTDGNPRLIYYPPRHSDNFKLHYNKKTSVERCDSRLKEFLNTDNLRSAGIRKAKAIALLNCISLIAGTISVNRVNNN